MATLDEIEGAIDRLSRDEFVRLAEWFREREQGEWDRQMEQDTAAGKLDFLWKEAEAERAAGTLVEWPPTDE
jgi:hypothetical protein